MSKDPSEAAEQAVSLETVTPSDKQWMAGRTDQEIEGITLTADQTGRDPADVAQEWARKEEAFTAYLKANWQQLLDMAASASFEKVFAQARIRDLRIGFLAGLEASRNGSRYDPIDDENRQFSLDQFIASATAELHAYLQTWVGKNEWHQATHTWREWFTSFHEYMSW